MPVGSCFCGKIQLEFTNSPITSGLCYCSDCRKNSGSLFTYSFVFRNADVKITGSPKVVTKRADSGNTVKNHFCDECGTPLYGLRVNPDGSQGESMIVRAGIFDNLSLFNQVKPKAELYVDGRVSWLCPIEGAEQFVGMVPLP
ncbi:hypothetical protein AN5940.2 [Aspergillus nidulans FGSC A4]|uniref:DUF636 domain protein (AFU_orthologue AFUA_1G03180) n=1 Tax=Emericella nidulans (strain FGSC A4 / ATCC 38163 / CBS 112.46 / NRRL 194 / M139) TaxID=227321 RepID=Q5B0J0_EMENI|nr:hypothetical protein [Aspergillus nidulans FGSC A4]EAA57803.1 hypothetical protein AN5940.2 [Aspergillus nidulans FGSC A4]CBF70524.1 TPA: DUF636 domain protein (AFU_orthologue; AFUA_1G03180) [Aspergillus nidulans FGSC A4]|eukprot:XP_663544.1 hypothetical protein AN5940.2 [Aspergillus nidulans FGSC A4]